MRPHRSLFSIKTHLAWLIISLAMLHQPACSNISKTSPQSSFRQQIATLERTSNGRIGVYAINTGNQSHLEYRAQERFPMGCTSKVMGVAAILHQSMNQPSLLSQQIIYTKNDLTNWAPITSKHLMEGMTVSNLCAAAIRYSDNTAMNLLVKELGGLEQINVFAHSIQNKTFRQDHDWPKEAFSGGQGNVMDSSTPKDMAKSLQKILLTSLLDKPQRDRLLYWLKNNTTGDLRIRSGVPKGWVVADKTGTGSDYGTTNDIGIIWPPQCAPIILAVYYTSNHQKAIQREDMIASVTHIVLNQWAKDAPCLHT